MVVLGHLLRREHGRRQEVFVVFYLICSFVLSKENEDFCLDTLSLKCTSDM